MLIEAGSKLIMTGDSVTDCDRARPVGEGLFGAIGNGYVNFVQVLVLMTPYYIEPNTNDAMRSTMDKYGAVVKTISQKYGTYLVDTQAAFNKIFEHYHPNLLSWDRVHPNNIGHMVLVRAFLKAIEFEDNWRG